ncbi:uncharacterized protein LOC134825531 [Bolinopsis microptera]|uniref:uncharacterized protein LOC134825531 n=1 Tax=Bolinopsis microptera TaxID=2820187 RepID=UPI003078F432
MKFSSFAICICLVIPAVLTTSPDLQLSGGVKVSKSAFHCKVLEHHRMDCFCLSAQFTVNSCHSLLGEDIINSNKYKIDHIKGSLCRNHRMNCRSGENTKQCCRSLLCYRNLGCR